MESADAEFLALEREANAEPGGGGAPTKKMAKRPKPPPRRRYSMSLTQGALDDFLAVVDLPESIAEEVSASQTLEVTCPEGVAAGDTLFLQYNDDEIEVTVPEGIGPGDDFEVSVEVSRPSPRCADRSITIPSPRSNAH